MPKCPSVLQVPKCLKYPSVLQVPKFFKCLSAQVSQVSQVPLSAQVSKYLNDIIAHYAPQVPVKYLRTLQVSKVSKCQESLVSKCRSITQMLLMFQMPQVPKCLVAYSVVFILCSVLFLFHHWNLQSN